MRLITRSDFDGLVCGALLLSAGVIDSWMFVHPKDMQDGLIPVGKDDVLANLPYAKGCGLWFDHHPTELDRLRYEGEYMGEGRIAPSAARIIYDYYGGKERFPNFDELMLAVDKVNSADLTEEEVLDPKGWILLGFLMDPRTGLGRFKHFTISNYQLMEKLLICCSQMTAEEILAMPDVKERAELYAEQSRLFIDMVRAHTRTKGDVIITDLRDADPIYAGNRFLIYTLYPEQNISVWIVRGRGGKGVSVAVGYSVFNRTSTVDIGELVSRYGGGGRVNVGTCQLSDEDAEQKIDMIINEIANSKKEQKK